ncbi:MAG: glycosyltransferase family 2 protein [Myxococcales bacterium]|nr:glycosyltransferase family 2 protein [Myxococcales bacterium]
MSNSDSLAGFNATVDARDSASVVRVVSALQAARPTILQDGKMLFLQCAGGTIPKDIEALLGEWGYEAIARIPASKMVCFAVAGGGAIKASEGPSPKVRLGVSVRENLEVLQDLAKTTLEKNSAYKGLRNVALEFRGLRPASLRGRKLHKLLVSPGKFLEDSSHTVLSGPGLRVFKLVAPAAATREARRKVTVYDVPKRTLVLCVGAGCELNTTELAEFSHDLGLRTELIVMLSSAHAASVPQTLAELRCPRARVYTIWESSTDELLRHGIERSYATDIAVVALPMSCGRGAVEHGFSCLSPNRDHRFESANGLVLARRDTWHDFFSGERELPDLKAGMDTLRNKLGVTSLATAENLSETELVTDSCRYSGVEPSSPFHERGDDVSRVECFDRRPIWPTPMASDWKHQISLVSVIMTAYNGADTLAAAIDSVLDQTYRNIELLVVDDCSPDDSLAVARAKAAKDDRIRVLQTARNSGTYYAKNVGLRFARGVFVTFHYSDDVSSLNRVELQAQALSSDPGSIGNYTRYQRLSEDGNEVWFNGRTNRSGYITLMIRREAAMSSVGFFDSVRVSVDAEDVERLNIATGRDVRLLPVVSYYALQAEGSLTTAGAAAFAVDADGRTTMPPIRQIYRDAARQWHESVFEGLSSAIMPFPLGQRPFRAQPEIRPEREGRDASSWPVR